MCKAAEQAVAQGLSVRELEKMAKKANSEAQLKFSQPRSKKRVQYFDEVELALNEHLGRKVQVQGSKTKGTLQIEFYGEEDLANLLNSLHLKD